MTNKKGYTLMELIIVVIIVGVLTSLAIVNYAKTREDVYDKEASCNLKTLQAAEGSYNMDMGAYYPSAGSVSDIASINANLKVFIVSSGSRAWDYTVWSSGCVQSDRLGYDNRTWYLNVSDANREPVLGSGCP